MAVYLYDRTTTHVRNQHGKPHHLMRIHLCTRDGLWILLSSVSSVIVVRRLSMPIRPREHRVHLDY